jgi:hypothetical protein
MLRGQAIGQFVIKESRWENSLYVETFQRKVDAPAAHIYKTAKSFDNCELEAGATVAYVEIWEYNQDGVWKEALEYQYSEKLLNPNEFRFLGPPITEVMRKLVGKDVIMFDPVSVHKGFYAALEGKVDGSINDHCREIAEKIEESVNMFLEETDYRLYSKMNQLRFAFDNREPIYDDIDKLSFENEKFQEAIGRVAKCAPLLEALYNKDVALLEKSWKSASDSFVV